MVQIAIIVNSCFEFYEKTIDVLIASAKKAGVPTGYIYVVVGQSDVDSEIISKDGYNIVFCRYVNIDYNGVIYFTQTDTGLEELQNFTHFFYVHDTCTFMDGFWKNINIAALNCDSYIKLERGGSKNMALFNVQWFIESKKDLLSYFINYDKTLQLKYKGGQYVNKSLIFDKYKNLPRNLNEGSVFIFPEESSSSRVFRNEVTNYMSTLYSSEERRAIVFKNPGIIKYQKNWGLPVAWNLKL